MSRLFNWKTLVFAVTLAALSSSPAHAEGSGIAWRTDLETAKADAAKEKKLIFMDIHAEWCPPCKLLESQTFPDAGVQKLLTEFIPLSFDADKSPDMVEKYSDGSLPTLAVLDEKGRLLESQVGYLDAGQFQTWLNTARKAGDEMAALEAKLRDNPADAETALDLAARYMRIREGVKAANLLKGLPAPAVAKLSEENQAQLLYTRGMAAYGAEAYDEGVAALREFQKRFPSDPRTSDLHPYILQGVYLGARKDFQAGNLDKARDAYNEIAKDTSIPGAAETAQMELARIDRFGKDATPLDIQEWASGGPVDLAKLKGKVVLLNFFQITDPTAESTHLAMNAMQQKFGADLATVGIAVAFEAPDKQQPSDIKTYVSQNAYGFPVGIDRDLSKTFSAYAGLGSPWTAILDQQGKIVFLDFFDDVRVLAKLNGLLKK